MVQKVLFSEKEKLLKYDIMSRDFGMDEPHFHNFYEIYFLVYGSCRFSIENRIFDIKKNDMLIIPPGQIHIASDYFEMSNRIIIHFPATILDTAFNKRLKTFRQNNYYVPQKPAYIAELLKKMQAELLDNDPISDQVSKSYLILLLEYIIRNESSTKLKASQVTTINLTEDLMTYVIDNYQHDISIQDLSDKFGYSPNYISALFKKNAGIGYKNFLLLQRIKNAEYMLITTDKSILEIAITCGFNDSNYFSTIFKKIHGISPREYRKNNYRN